MSDAPLTPSALPPNDPTLMAAALAQLKPRQLSSCSPPYSPLEKRALPRGGAHSSPGFCSSQVDQIQLTFATPPTITKSGNSFYHHYTTPSHHHDHCHNHLHHYLHHPLYTISHRRFSTLRTSTRRGVNFGNVCNPVVVMWVASDGCVARFWWWVV